MLHYPPSLRYADESPESKPRPEVAIVIDSLTGLNDYACSDCDFVASRTEGCFRVSKFNTMTVCYHDWESRETRNKPKFFEVNSYDTLTSRYFEKRA